MTEQEIRKFYGSYSWKKTSRSVYAMDHNECTICRAKGRYSPAEIAHHTNHLKDKPEWGLNIYYTNDDGEVKRNIISVCRECHETVCHPERLRWREAKVPLTKERW